MVALESTSNDWIPGERESHESTAHACRLLLTATDKVHLVSVKNKIPGPVPDPVERDVLSPADREVFAPADTPLDEETRVHNLLEHASHSAIFNNYHPSIHVIDPEGGVREALVAFCKGIGGGETGDSGAQLVMMGPVRGGDGVGGVLRSLLGFGSVSEYALHHLDVPIAVFHDVEGAMQPEGDGKKKRVLVCVDSLSVSSDASRDRDGHRDSTESLLRWVVENILGDLDVDSMHIVSCALRAPYDIVDEECACAIGEIMEEEQARDEEMWRLAEEAVARAKAVAVGLGVAEGNVCTEVVQADGEDARGVVRALSKVASEGGYDVVCAGKRAMTGVARTLKRWIGEGSVSDGLTKVGCSSGMGVVVIVPD